MRLQKAKIHAAAIAASLALLFVASPALAQDSNSSRAQMSNSNLGWWDVDWNWNDFGDRFKERLAEWLAGHQGTKPPVGVAPAQTPELGSLLLFGSGLVGASGYALMRVRTRKRSE